MLAFTSSRSCRRNGSLPLPVHPAGAGWSIALSFIYPLGQTARAQPVQMGRHPRAQIRRLATLPESSSSDDRFWEAISHNFSWMIAAIIVPVLFGLLLAILLSRSSMYGSIIFRTIFFMPQVFSSVTVALIWQWIYNPSYGAINVFPGFDRA